MGRGVGEAVREGREGTFVLESEWFDAHHCIPSVYHSSCHIAGAQCIFTKGRKTTKLKAMKIQLHVDFAATYLIFLVMGLYRDIITVQAPQPPPPQPYLVPVSRTGKE